jgi:quinol monooxygenase YgiN
MFNKAINTVKVQAVAGRSDELGKQLQKIVETLRELPGCESYMVDRCPEDSNLWTVSAHWQSEAAMRSHFNSPQAQGFIDLIDCQLANAVDFNSFPIR